MFKDQDKRVTSTNQARALLATIQKQYPRNLVTEGYLLSMFPLTGTVNSFKFPLLINQTIGNTVQCIEKRLALSDRFVVRDWSIMLMQVLSAGATPTNAEVSVGVPRTYPQNNVFTAAVAANLESLYNSSLTVSINSVVYYQAFPVRNFYRVPTSQAGAAVSTVATVGILNRDGWDNMNWAFSPVYPTFTVDGLGNNEITLNMPNPTTLTAQAGNFNFCNLYLRGYLVQNVNQK